MRALLLTNPNEWTIGEAPDPTYLEDEVVIEVAGCGVCGTDLHALAGNNPLVRFPAIPGHEFGGTVVTVGSKVDWLNVGDRVVVDPSRFCGHCPQCLAGRHNLCPNKGGYGSRFPGGFAERTAVRATSCVKVPESMPWEIALLAEPLACVIHGVERLGDFTGADAIVVGGGPIGMLTATLLRHKGANVALVEKSDLRRNLAIRSEFSPVAASLSELARADAEIVVDATGVPSAIEEGFTKLRRGGTLLLMGVAKAGSTITLDPHRINWQELSILGSPALKHSFGRSVALLEHIGDEVKDLVTDNVPLAEFDHALELVRSQGSVKVLVRP